MAKTILGKKIGMTQVWNENDEIVPVTVIQTGPCTVAQVKTKETDGYNAIQIGFGDISDKHVNKPMAGHFAKAGINPTRYLREVRLSEEESFSVGDQITVNEFAEANKVHVTGISKGKGFAGTIKRHGFGSGPGGHGSHFHRAPGSIGQCASPSRVFKGVRMAGQMGNDRVTVRNLQLVRIDEEQNLILVKGAIPGGQGALVTIRMA